MINTRPAWRPMQDADLTEVNSIADLVHPDFPESAAIPAERLRLYPAGCLVLDHDGVLLGYAISHPWHAGTPPALDILLGALPDTPAIYYIHDLALLPMARGTGAAGEAVRLMLAQTAKVGLTLVILVAVNNSVAFWQREAFAVVGPAPVSYGPAARLMAR